MWISIVSTLAGLISLLLGLVFGWLWARVNKINARIDAANERFARHELMDAKQDGSINDKMAEKIKEHQQACIPIHEEHLKRITAMVMSESKERKDLAILLTDIKFELSEIRSDLKHITISMRKDVDALEDQVKKQIAEIERLKRGM